MSERWDRFKRWFCGQDRIDQMNREFERRMEWHREDIERSRKQARAELRDRFAVAALTGLLAYQSDCQGTSKNPLERFSKRAYQYADAMLKAREENSQ